MKGWRQLFVDLFDECQHGDREHREWLRDKFIEYANSITKAKVLPTGALGLKKEDFTIKEQ